MMGCIRYRYKKLPTHLHCYSVVVSGRSKFWNTCTLHTGIQTYTAKNIRQNNRGNKDTGKKDRQLVRRSKVVQHTTVKRTIYRLCAFVVSSLAHGTLQTPSTMFICKKCICSWKGCESRRKWQGRAWHIDLVLVEYFLNFCIPSKWGIRIKKHKYSNGATLMSWYFRRVMRDGRWHKNNAVWPENYWKLQQNA